MIDRHLRIEPGDSQPDQPPQAARIGQPHRARRCPQLSRLYPSFAPMTDPHLRPLQPAVEIGLDRLTLLLTRVTSDLSGDVRAASSEFEEGKFMSFPRVPLPSDQAFKGAQKRREKAIEQRAMLDQDDEGVSEVPRKRGIADRLRRVLRLGRRL